jgi:hypothetical protein
VSSEVRIWWAEPGAGDIVWCRFPDGVSPRAKPRPALVLIVFDDEQPEFEVTVAYGTSKKTTSLHAGEFAILRASNPQAYALAGLSFDTKFDLGKKVILPFNSEFFAPPPARPFGESPKLGTLHPSLVRAVQAAHRATGENGAKDQTGPGSGAKSRDAMKSSAPLTKRRERRS